jgi:hypothetical protein
LASGLVSRYFSRRGLVRSFVVSVGFEGFDMLRCAIAAGRDVDGTHLEVWGGKAARTVRISFQCHWLVSWCCGMEAG